MDISKHVLNEFRRGNIEPFYLEIYPSLQRYAERVLGADSAYEAEDCIQEAIYKVYQSRREFANPMQMRAFMFTCIHNEIVSLFRKNQTQGKYKKNYQEELDDNIFDNLVLQETLDRLYRAIDALPPHLHQIFEMSFEQGLQNIEIAKLLEVSPETIKKRKAKMIRLLRKQVGNDDAVALLFYIIFAP